MIILNQVLIIALLFIVGIICYKTKIITAESCKSFSAFIINIVNPALMIISYQMEMNAERLRGLVVTFLLSLLAFAVIIPAGTLINRRSKNRETDTLAAIYPNCGFFGIPIINGLYGTEGVFYLSIFISVFNIMFWTHGVLTYDNSRLTKKSILRLVKSPTLIAIVIGMALFVGGISIPDPFYSAIDYISKMNTPIAMIVAGVSIAQLNLPEDLKNLGIYKIVFQRLLFLPALLLPVFWLIPMPPMIKTIVIIAAACPVATTSTILAIEKNRSPQLMTQYFSVSTMLALFTIPIFQFLAGLIFH